MAAAFFAAGAASAVNISPQTMQCDGTFQSGGNTHARNPSIQIAMQSTTFDAGGIRINGAPSTKTGMGALPNYGATFALWRFDTSASNITVALSCYSDSVHCPTSGNCWDYQYQYFDVNHSTTVVLGDCVYDGGTAPTPPSTACIGTPVNHGLMSGLTPPNVTPPAGLSCPAAGGTLPIASPGETFPASSSYSSPISYSGNGAITFNGAQFARVTAIQNWLLGGTYSLSAWIKPTATASEEDILAYDEFFYGGYENRWALSLNSSGHLQLSDTRDPTATTSAGPVLTDGNWHQVTAVRNNGVDRRLYVDGNLVGVFTGITSTGPFTIQTAAGTVYDVIEPMIGADIELSTDNPSIRQAGPSNYFNGQIDELRVVGAALTAEDVRLEYTGSAIQQYSSNGGFSYSTAPGAFISSPLNGTQSLVYYSTGTGGGEAVTAATAANQSWIFEAQSTESVTSISPAYQVTINQALPSAPLSVSGAPASNSSIVWSWTAPTTFCPPPGSSSVYYQLFDAAHGGGALSPPGNMAYTNLVQPTSVAETSLASNTLYSRRLQLTDTWGTSPLSASASAYTLASPPTGLSAAGVSTGGFVATWNANGNPGYTRYELSVSPDQTFATGVSTPAALGANFLATTIPVTGLLSGTTYYARVRAYSSRVGDPVSGTPTTYASLAFVTDPGAPPLSGTPLSNSSILWQWTPVSGATGFTLYDSPTQAILLGPNGSGVSYTSSTLSINTLYSAEVEADLPSPSPPSARGHAFTYTLANPPTGPTTATAFISSATFTWNPNSNPAGTFYHVVVAADAGFTVVVATLSVSAPVATVTGLLPGKLYYSEVQALNGVQIPTTFAAIPAAQTNVNTVITVSTAPPSPYVSAAGLVGAWQLDEGTGTTTADSSGQGNAASFLCAGAGCASTPTWAAGPPGMGSAASFSGLANGVVQTNSPAPFEFTGSLSVEAWVYPQTGVQSPDVGIVAVGRKNSEDFALDVFGNAFRFVTSNGGAEYAVTVPTAAIAAGQWTHVVGVYNSAGPSALYLNGRLAALANLPARANSALPLDIGNRLDASGNLSLPFNGRVDSVRVFSTALTASQVLADYQGAFVSSVTAAPPNTGIVVGLPPNAFAAPVEIFISADPLNNPIIVPPAAISAGLTVLPPGLTMVPNSMVEIVPVVSGTPFTTLLGSSATLSIPYTAANNIIGGTNPPLAASGLRMYTLNTSVNRWEALPTSVDSVASHATGVTPHFSVFALFAPSTIAAGVSGVRVYPVPWKPGTGGRFDAPGVTFANLPVSGTIRILTLAGRSVRTFTFSGASAGTAVWNGLNDDGRRAASGVYFARIQSDAEGATSLVKFAIER
jgi:hypothetical protein